jgi:hypothetical protein
MDPNPVQFTSSKMASKAENASVSSGNVLPTLNEINARQEAIEGGYDYRMGKASAGKPTAGPASPVGLA